MSKLFQTVIITWSKSHDAAELLTKFDTIPFLEARPETNTQIILTPPQQISKNPKKKKVEFYPWKEMRIENKPSF